MKSLLAVSNLSVEFSGRESKLTAVNGVSFELHSGEILGIVGESGSGKSMLVSSLIRLLPKGARAYGEKVSFDGKDILNISEKEMVRLRGKDISMIFQDPAASLSPTATIGRQLMEVFVLHENLKEKEAREKSVKMLEKVGLTEPELRMKQYPHELSGGMLQRVMIAIALATKPKLLIADEPTTALDVTMQAQILKLVKKLCEEINTAVIIISHDLRIISEIAQKVIVMKEGRFVEISDSSSIFERPEADYTKFLIESMPDMRGTGKDTDRSGGHKLLQVKDVRVSFYKDNSIFAGKKAFDIVNGVSFDIYKGEVLGLVGESGCGKSTLSRAILKVIPIKNGDILFNEKSISSASKKEMAEIREKVQLIFQNSFGSLNPKMTVEEILKAPLKIRGVLQPEMKKRIAVILKEVGLDEAFLERYPHELSGGQKQRIVIARALIGEPEFVVCDEPVSALDVSVQAQVLGLLDRLKTEKGLTYLFISHDLSVVRNISDRIAVMYKGEIVELERTEDIFNKPKHPYTKKLLESIPGYNKYKND